MTRQCCDRKADSLLDPPNVQHPNLDYDETFNLVVKSATVCTVLTWAPSRGWLIHHLHVKSVFLHDTLNKTVY
jgi:hypothetical protein